MQQAPREWPADTNVLLPGGASGGDFPANASLARRLKQGCLNLITLSTVGWTTVWLKRDKAAVIAKGRQQRGNGLLNLLRLHKRWILSVKVKKVRK
jgi:hypothetical protein